MKTPATTSMVTTNAYNHDLAGYLADAKHGVTFSSVIYKKVGKGAKRLGQDLCLYVFVTGFSYTNMLRSDLVTIKAISANELRTACVTADKRDKNGNHPTLTDCEKAIQEQTESLQRSLAGTAVSTTDGVRDPLMVDGQRVSGGWVNNGSADSAKTGNVNIDGICISKKVLEADPNQPNAVRSAAKTVAKDLLKKKFLKIGRWMSLSLTAGTDFHLKIGGSAVAHATENGIDEIDGMSTREAWEATQQAA